MKVRKVAIVGGSRIPFCRSNTKYSKATNKDMLTAALNGVVEKFDLQGEVIGEVASGAVLKQPWDWNLTREAVLSTELSPHTPAYDLQMACGTSLQVALNMASKIAVGQMECGIAAGVDTTSDAPIALNDGLRKILLELNRARTPAERLKLIAKIRPKHLTPKLPGTGEPRTKKAMGEHCEMMVKDWNISREAQDLLAFESHSKAAAAYERGFFSDLIVPFNGVDVDNNLRPDTKLEKLATLKPAFDKTSGKGTLTAANSTPLTDGAAAVLLATEEWAKARNLPILGYLTYGKTAAIEFTKEEGLLMAPAYAVPQMLDDAGLTLQDFDFYEIHEAFAGQVLCTLAAWESEEFCKEKLGRDKALGSIDRAKLNVNGSSLAVGHPFAATGARILATLGKILDENGGGRGLISVCTAGGMGVTAIVER